ncbi:MAG: Crp/Fnr family transcriptional regulator [Sphingomonadaceae bacterium]
MSLAVDDAELRDREASLPSTLHGALLARAQMMHVKRGQIVIADESPSTDVYFIVSGCVQVSLATLHGNETILREMGAGRLFGELAAIDGHPRSATVVALQDSMLAQLSAADFEGFLASSPQASLWMVRQLAARVRNLTQKAFELATMSVGNRLQSELIRLAEMAGIADDQSMISPLPTHANLAARLGTHREAVTRELGALANEGVIAQQGRTLTIYSVSALRTLRRRTMR